jgi:hypothetical protein
MLSMGFTVTSSRKVTRVKIDTVPPLSLIDFIPLEQAIEEATQHYMEQLHTAGRALEALRKGNFSAYHQYGIYRSRIVRVLKEQESA